MDSGNIVKRGFGAIFKGFSADIESRNWSVYGQWLGVACFFVDLVLGVINLLHLNLLIIFGVLSIVSALCILFLEFGFLLRICPVTDKFAAFIKFFHANLPRAGFYIILAAIQWGSIGIAASSLIAPAAVMTITSICYFLAYMKNQDFIKSATLGGEGVAREMIV